MPKLRVKVIWDGQSWMVDLPEYSMVAASFLPAIDGVSPNGVVFGFDPTLPQFDDLNCEVEVPDRIVDSKTGIPDIEKINALYLGNPRWGSPELNLNI